MPLIDFKTFIIFVIAILGIAYLSDIPNKIFIGGAISKDSTKRGLNPKLWFVLTSLLPASIVWRFYVYRVNPTAKAIEYEPLNAYTPSKSGNILFIIGIISIITGILGLITGGIKSEVLGLPVAALLGVGLFFTPYYYLSSRWQKTGKPNPLDKVIGGQKTRGQIVKVLIIIILTSLLVSIFAFIFIR